MSEPVSAAHGAQLAPQSAGTTAPVRPTTRTRQEGAPAAVTTSTAISSTTPTRRSVGAIARTAVAVAGAVVLTGAGAVAAQADEHSAAPAHGHILVLGVQFGDEGLTFRNCVNVAAGQQLPLRAHHEHLHHGTAGEALQAAGNYVVPTAPRSEWTDCAAFEATFRP